MHIETLYKRKFEKRPLKRRIRKQRWKEICAGCIVTGVWNWGQSSCDMTAISLRSSASSCHSSDTNPHLTFWGEVLIL
jgi:hypothetical protein